MMLCMRKVSRRLGTSFWPLVYSVTLPHSWAVKTSLIPSKQLLVEKFTGISVKGSCRDMLSGCFLVASQTSRDIESGTYGSLQFLSAISSWHSEQQPLKILLNPCIISRTRAQKQSHVLEKWVTVFNPPFRRHVNLEKCDLHVLRKMSWNLPDRGPYGGKKTEYDIFLILLSQVGHVYLI